MEKLLVDYLLSAENILIECKATERQQYPSINPTNELIYNSLKQSIFKAYFEQLLVVTKNIKIGNGVLWYDYYIQSNVNPETYKQLFHVFIFFNLLKVACN